MCASKANVELRSCLAKSMQASQLWPGASLVLWGFFPSYWQGKAGSAPGMSSELSGWGRRVRSGSWARAATNLVSPQASDCFQRVAKLSDGIASYYCKDWFLFKLSNVFGRKSEIPSKNDKAWFSPALLCLRAKKVDLSDFFFSPYSPKTVKIEYPLIRTTDTASLCI